MNEIAGSKTFHRPDVILFSVQISLIFVVVLASLINLTLQLGNQNLWMMLLTSCLGYLMPNPKIKLINGQLETSH